MREIRFRAWDKKTKIMVKVNEIYSPVLEEGYEHEKGDQGYHVTGKKGYCPPAGQLILMQYTGLKDKNGTEIYEGDILRRAKKHGYYKQLRVVNLEYYNESIFASESEVIGNIYENEELLTK